MKKDFVTVIYDRKKEEAKTGRGKVEICIYLGNGANADSAAQNKATPLDGESKEGHPHGSPLHQQLFGALLKNLCHV